ncbi:MAG: phosphoglycerate kinase [Coriobacteriia bacterium]|nr:phosphoglycerate kinase [Coriobacteriia bacterium]
MSEIKKVDSIECQGKKVIVRVDFNVPVKDGKVTDDTRIRRALPTIKTLLDKGAKVILMSHLGRPSGEGFESDFSLEPASKRLAELVDTKVIQADDICGEDAKAKADALQPGEILVLQNLRFDKREKKNDPEFAKELASLADLYVNDAFGTAHRAHASTAGVADYLPAYGGYLILNEVETLGGMLENPKRPFCAILGGAKVSDKIKVINSLIDKCDTLIIGGGMAYTFLVSQGKTVGKSILEEDWVDKAGEMLEKAASKGVKVLLPVDVVVADEFAADANHKQVSVDEIPDDMEALDIGDETVKLFSAAIAESKTIFWNGPCGVFEFEAFAKGTKAICEAVAANRDADSIIGGGDSVAAVNKYGLADQMTFVSTGGGASMELVQGEKLPGVEALRR